MASVDHRYEVILLAVHRGRCGDPHCHPRLFAEEEQRLARVQLGLELAEAAR